MRRPIIFFLTLLLVLNVYLLMRQRLLPLLESAIAINAAACCWMVMNAFAPPEQKVVVQPRVQALVIVLLLMFDSLVYIGAYTRMELRKQTFIDLAVPAPSFSLAAFDGGAHKLAEFSGKPVILHFWGTWCIPCRKEFPKLIAYAGRHPEITFIAFDANDDAAKADVFVKQAKPPKNILFLRDPEGVVSLDHFRVPGFPVTILVDAHGQMRREYVGSIDWENGDVDHAIETLHLAKP